MIPGPSFKERYALFSMKFTLPILLRTSNHQKISSGFGTGFQSSVHEKAFPQDEPVLNNDRFYFVRYLKAPESRTVCKPAVYSIFLPCAFPPKHFRLPWLYLTMTAEIVLFCRHGHFHPKITKIFLFDILDFLSFFVPISSWINVIIYTSSHITEHTDFFNILMFLCFFNVM